MSNGGDQREVGQPLPACEPGSRRPEDWRTALLLAACVALVVFWQIASHRASRPFEALRLDAAHFASFSPSAPAWQIRRVHAKASPTEPTLLAFEARPQGCAMAASGVVAQAPVLVRLVHGYNLVDCMRIKQYKVELLEDRRHASPPAPAAVTHAADAPMQVWLLTAPDGLQTIWISSMLRMTDLVATATDTRDMAFPRVGTPDDPGWSPSGLRWSSLQHPLRNGQRFLRSKWNASRADWLTFLRLRQPAWASDVMLTLVSEFRGTGSVEADSRQAVIAHVLAVHRPMLQSLASYGETHPVATPDGEKIKAKE